MRHAQIFRGLVAFLAISVSPACGAEKILLREAPLQEAGASCRVQLEVRGKLLVRAANQAQTDQQRPTKPLPMAIDGELQYDERVLPDRQGRRSAVRFYRKNQAKVVVDGRIFHPQLREENRLVQVDVEGEEVSIRSVQGPLAREELELLAVQGNGLLLHRLLPDREVALGESWAINGNAAAPVFGLEEAYSAGIQATLKTVADGIAAVHIEGQIDGAVGSVPSHVDFQADLQFDSETRQITMFDVSFDEQREISGGEPGIEAHSHLRLTRTTGKIPPELQDSAFTRLPETAGEEVLRYRAPNGKFSMIHGPQWRVISDTPKRTTLRLLDGGDVIAQGNLSMLDNLPQGSQLTLEAYEEDVRATLSNLKGEVLQSEENKLDSGLRALRITGAGQVEEVDVEWIYLHVSDDLGRRVSCVFTLEQKRAEQFRGADLSLLNGLEFTTATAQAPDKNPPK